MAGLPIPPRCGIGLREPHVGHVLEFRPKAVAWIEVHAENYMDGGAQAEVLQELARHYAVSLHAVGLSLASPQGLSQRHLARLVALERQVQPALVSDHLSWSMLDGRFYNDLLPFPYSDEALNVVADNVRRAQDALGRRLLVENPSRYVDVGDADFTESGFLAELVDRTGCGVLLDVNNAYVTCANLGQDLDRYIDQLPMHAVDQIHVAGHEIERTGGRTLRVDTHGEPVADEVWELLAAVRQRLEPGVPMLLERDAQLPPIEVLLREAALADACDWPLVGARHHAHAA
jgi:uncharacterized protein